MNHSLLLTQNISANKEKNEKPKRSLKLKKEEEVGGPTFLK